MLFRSKEVFPKMRFINIDIRYDSVAGITRISKPEDIVKPRSDIEIAEQPIQMFDKPNQMIDQPEQIIEFVKKPLFAAKTNLLFDAMTVLNVEVEVPIRKHWSIAGEWIFPWWLHYRNKLKKLVGV